MTWFADRDDHLPAVSHRSVERQLTRTDQNALLRARQVQADGFVATVALHELHGVASLASSLADRDPNGAQFYGHIVQRTAIAMGNTIDGRFVR